MTMDLDIGSCFEIRENACLVDSIFSYCLYCYSYARCNGFCEIIGPSRTYVNRLNVTDIVTVRDINDT